MYKISLYASYQPNVQEILAKSDAELAEKKQIEEDAAEKEADFVAPVAVEENTEVETEEPIVEAEPEVIEEAPAEVEESADVEEDKE